MEIVAFTDTEAGFDCAKCGAEIVGIQLGFHLDDEGYEIEEDGESYRDWLNQD